jgi:cytochrome c peroxidase
MFRHLLASGIAALLLFISMPPDARAQVARSPQLPVATDLGEEAWEVPREVFRSEASGGHKSYLVVLGDVAFSSPRLLGAAARQAGISCATCHVNGASNPRLYIPGLSTRPGNIDTTGHLFNPAADDGVLNPLTIPSLRGAHMLAPYGHDGRTLSLRDFVRNVIVTEFAGTEPPSSILDALVSYIEDIDFVPNAHLQASGRLSAANTPAARRGEKLFRRPFPHDPELSCAACHQPDQAFLDHRQHDVGSGGHFKTPTLINANFNAPYFHDGRYDSYAQVIAHFNRVFSLRFSAREQQDLLAYLQAVGDGERALQPDMIAIRVRELDDFAAALDTALPAHDADAARLVLETLDSELRELTEKFPERRDPAVHGGEQERARARAALKSQVLLLRAVELAVEDGRFADASSHLSDYRSTRAASVTAMLAAEPWSLFARTVHDEHYATVRRYFAVGTEPTAAR